LVGLDQDIAMICRGVLTEGQKSFIILLLNNYLTIYIMEKDSKVTRWAEIVCQVPDTSGKIIRRVTELGREEDGSIPLESDEVGCTSAFVQACHEVRDGVFQLTDKVFCRDSGKQCPILNPEDIEKYLDVKADENSKNIF